MGIQRPDPTAKEGKYNCPLMTFSDVIRSEFYDLCERQGVVIDREVKSPSQKHLSVLEYKCQQMTAEVATLSAERAETQAQEQEQFMRQLGIWQRFVQMLEAQRQQTYHRTR